MPILDLLLIPLALFYLLIVGTLFVYGINFFYLTWVALQGNRAQGEPGPLATQPETEAENTALPRVTVQLPIYNERYVAGRLIDAAARLDYPPDRLEIQVLDDSTDDTVQIIAGRVAEWQARGLNIHHIHRADRQGYKAGALAHGLERASGEFIAIFDADFVPTPDFLLRALPHFETPDIAFVQTRWDHLNRDYSILTQLQAISIDGHFAVEQFARHEHDHWFNFNGTAGIWRKAAIEDAGGWRAETLTEDLDLSYRAFFHGWRAVYTRQVAVPAELPVSFNAYRRQQSRWARGSMECALRYVPEIWRMPVSTGKKIEATLHLTGYGVHLLLFGLSVLYPFVLLVSQRYPELVTLFGIGGIFNIAALAPTVFFTAGQGLLGRGVTTNLPKILFMTILGMGMMMNTLRSALQILTAPLRRERAGVFERTPKLGILGEEPNEKGGKTRQDWLSARYQIRLDGLVAFEFLYGMFNLGTAWYAFHVQNWIIGVFATLFAAGLFFTSTFTIAQSLAVLRRQRALARGTP